ncbi:uncharacterized protein LOC133314891, partial [Gastrolobium bilobum]|uniref:uncharacterized protein LOC133314891 n=1 Tax=Gastrolobium bilobum TaxID=150636 RepID=UPI002AB2EA38
MNAHPWNIGKGMGLLLAWLWPLVRMGTLCVRPKNRTLMSGIGGELSTMGPLNSPAKLCTMGALLLDVRITTSVWTDSCCCLIYIWACKVLRSPRRLEKNEVDIRVGNGARVAAYAVGDTDLILPTGLLLHLNNCLYVPSISRNIISISCLEQDGFAFTIRDDTFSIISNDIVF